MEKQTLKDQGYPIGETNKLIDKYYSNAYRQRLNRFERQLGNVQQLEKGLDTVKQLVQVEKAIKSELGLTPKVNVKSR